MAIKVSKNDNKEQITGSNREQGSQNRRNRIIGFVSKFCFAGKDWHHEKLLKNLLN